MRRIGGETENERDNFQKKKEKEKRKKEKKRIKEKEKKVFFGLVCLGFMTYQSLLVIKCQIHFTTNKQFYFKQFSLA